MPDHESLHYLMSRVWRAHRKLITSYLGETGLHRGQPPLLIALKHHDGAASSELAAMLDVSPATISNMVKRMERAGFVERRGDADDERISRVYLTGEGHAIQSEIRKVLLSAEEATLAEFTEQERAILQRYLTRMHDNLVDGIDAATGKSDLGHGERAKAVK